MLQSDVSQKLRYSPVIAAVKDDGGLLQSLDTECELVFLLYGSVCTVPGLVDQIVQAGKLAFVHLDLIDGLSAQDAAVDYIRQKTGAAGIISTRSGLIRRAAQLGLLSVQRFFLIDSMALASAYRQIEQGGPDYIEVLPGVAPKIIRRLAAAGGPEIIASGMITDKEDVMAALSAGASAVSTTCADVWYL